LCFALFFSRALGLCFAPRLCFALFLPCPLGLFFALVLGFLCERLLLGELAYARRFALESLGVTQRFFDRARRVQLACPFARRLGSLACRFALRRLGSLACRFALQLLTALAQGLPLARRFALLGFFLFFERSTLGSLALLRCSLLLDRSALRCLAPLGGLALGCGFALRRRLASLGSFAPLDRFALLCRPSFLGGLALALLFTLL
jgi:hypothetical protein